MFKLMYNTKVVLIKIIVFGEFIIVSTVFKFLYQLSVHKTLFLGFLTSTYCSSLVTQLGSNP